MNRILILGGSGDVGNSVYNELCSYFDVYATYFTNTSFKNNQHFHHFDLINHTIFDVLDEVQPTHVISALRGDFEAQLDAHIDLISYCQQKNCKLIFISSSNVFDAFSNYPSYEYDKTLSESIYGKLKMRIENMIMRMPTDNWVIARLPMVFGSNSYRLKELRETLNNNEAFEVFPNLVMNVTSLDRLSQQLHYIINRNKKGIYHLGSNNLIHHDEFIKEITEKLNHPKPVFKRVYTTNFDRYLAVLPKHKKLPKHLNFTSEQVILDSVKK